MRGRPCIEGPHATTRSRDRFTVRAICANAWRLWRRAHGGPRRLARSVFAFESRREPARAMRLVGVTPEQLARGVTRTRDEIANAAGLA